MSIHRSDLQLYLPISRGPKTNLESLWYTQLSSLSLYSKWSQSELEQIGQGRARASENLRIIAAPTWKALVISWDFPFAPQH